MPTPPLDAQQLCRHCDPDRFSFRTTEDLQDLPQVIGQGRAEEGLRFGLGMQRDGYHLYAMGPPQIGKKTFIRRFLEERAAQEAVPPDVCYVHNFKEPYRPRALVLPPGRGASLRTDLESALEELRTALPAAVESDEQRTRRQSLEEEVKERHDQALTGLKEEAERRGIALVSTPLGFAFAPVKDGEVVTPKQFESLTEEERSGVEQQITGLQDRLKTILEEAQGWERDARQKIRSLLTEVTTGVVHRVLAHLKERYADLPAVTDHLAALEKDVIENVGDFLKPPEAHELSGAGIVGLGATSPRLAPLRRYLVRVLVENREGKGAPVVYEDSPTLENLVGRIEHVAQMGALVTDFMLLQPGALHRANGGYLFLEAQHVFTQPFAWEGLKRALKSSRIKIESLGQHMGLISTVTLEPMPVPLSLKVILLGERLLYYLLMAHDSEFASLFKVAIDFEEEVSRTPDSDLLYARLVATVARRHGLKPLDRCAVAGVIERSARLAGDAEKLSAHMGEITSLLREADWWAGQAGRTVVGVEDVREAVEASERRAGRVRERVIEEIRRGTIFLDTTGSIVGQVNGLSLVQVGGFAFGRPSRITARVRMGRGAVVDIEREVALGGPLHSKGVMILGGFLGSRYAPEHPLSLEATLVFEQSYGPVEGDSASSAELYALLSALGRVPIRQSYAVTGSVDQHGRVQPIGGVNEKIEGFFDACVARGLTGEEGVLVPASNVKHLMLKTRVVEAVKAGKFRVFAVETIDQGMEILTGVPAGERLASGQFPEGTVNRRVEDRLVAMAERRRQFAIPPGARRGRKASDGE